MTDDGFMHSEICYSSTPFLINITHKVTEM